MGQNRQFVIKWPTGEHYIQNAYNIFVCVNPKFDPANRIDKVNRPKDDKLRPKSNEFAERMSTISGKDESMKTPFDRPNKYGVPFFREMGLQYEERLEEVEFKNDLLNNPDIYSRRDTPVINALRFNTGQGTTTQKYDKNMLTIEEANEFRMQTQMDYVSFNQRTSS